MTLLTQADIGQLISGPAAQANPALPERWLKPVRCAFKTWREVQIGAWSGEPSPL